MTVAVVGAGAIGGLLGARLARSGQDVVMIARGAHLAAMREHGVTVREPQGDFTVHPTLADDIAAVAGCEVVFITLKAHSLPPVAERIGAALAPGACVVEAMNGIPWWYFPDHHLESVDPGGAISRAIPPSRVIGSVVYAAAAVVEPGVIAHQEGDRFTVGEPDGSRSERVLAVSRMLAAAGFKAPIQNRLRVEIWLKLVGNATLNPVSAITRATMGEMLGDEPGRRLIRTLMEEVVTVARAVDVELPLTIEKRIEGAAGVGEHRTSMLQDLEAGKPLELDALLGAVIEIAGWKGVDVPALRVVYDLARVAERSARRAPDRDRDEKEAE